MSADVTDVPPTLDQALWHALHGAPIEALVAWARALGDGGALAAKLSELQDRPDAARRLTATHLKYTSTPAPWVSLTHALPAAAAALQRAALLNGLTLPLPPAPLPPSPPGEPAQPPPPATLDTLLLDLFSEPELRAFVKQLDESLVHDLPGPPVTLSQLVADTTSALARRGLVQRALFDALVQARPHRAQDIRRLQTVPTPPRAAPPPARQPRPLSAEALLIALSLGLPAPRQQAALRAALADAGLDVPHLGATPDTRWRPIVEALGHNEEGRRHLLKVALQVVPQAPALRSLVEEIG